jgi:hypothetical protein
MFKRDLAQLHENADLNMHGTIDLQACISVSFEVQWKTMKHLRFAHVN